MDLCKRSNCGATWCWSISSDVCYCDGLGCESCECDSKAYELTTTFTCLTVEMEWLRHFNGCVGEIQGEGVLRKPVLSMQVMGISNRRIESSQYR